MDQTGNLQTNLNNLPKVYFVSLINFFFKKSFMFSLFHKKTRQYTEGSADKLHKKYSHISILDLVYDCDKCLNSKHFSKI